MKVNIHIYPHHGLTELIKLDAIIALGFLMTDEKRKSNRYHYYFYALDNDMKLFF